ncbi:MAG: HrpE/YscL family type III secretion apparatus protein [Chlamydiales bacterium]|nr:HrpE/YscL family type III secretion apparatus protein [Chlamydiales bacterium]
MRFFSLLYQGEVHPADDEKVIPSEDFSILLEAKEILEKAKEDAKRYRTNTEIEGEELREKYRKEGFQEGLAQFNEHLLLFERHLRDLKIQLQGQILPLAIKVAQKVVSKELELHPETIVEIVIAALSPVTQNHRFTIYVNKADKEALDANKSKIKEILEQLKTLSIQERADISPGGCMIETESGIINATIENQWRALETAFEKHMKLQ